MIASMAAFSRQSHEATWGSLTWEIRTVNHRYLEITLRLPDFLREFEHAFREAIQKVLCRGKVEVVKRLQPGREVPFEMNVNQVLTERFGQSGRDGHLLPLISDNQCHRCALLVLGYCKPRKLRWMLSERPYLFY